MFITKMPAIEPTKDFMTQSAPAPAEPSGGAFQNMLNSAIEATEKAQAVSEINSYELALGDVDDLAQIQIDSLKAQTMIQTTVQLTSRVVSAYKEIMQMQI